MPRLFLGTYLSTNDQAALGQLPHLNSTLDTDWNCRVKWSKQNQLHLTWIFFGNVESNNIEDLCQAISKNIDTNRDHLAKNDTTLTYERLECWFSRKIPSLLALVPSSVNTNLLSYAKHIRAQLSKYAAADVRQQAMDEFKPHITLARLAIIKGQRPSLPSTKNKELLLDAIHGLANFLPLTQAINNIALIESTEQNGSHQYKTVQNFSLFDGNSTRY